MRDRSLRSGERQVAEDLSGIEAWHRWRYSEALSYVENKHVLDLGCGTGYGSWMMAMKAFAVEAIDDSQEAIDHAQAHFARENICYMRLDMPNPDFDCLASVIVAFEIIEHIADTEAVFEFFKRIGPEKILCSTPHLKCPIGGNTFHHRHYGMDELITRFQDIGYFPLRAELRYFGKGLCNFLVMQKGPVV